MIDLGLVLRGALIGFSIAAPVGPIGVLCIRRSLVDGRLVGFVTGLGAATADAFYGWLAGLGVSLVSAVLVSQETWLRLFGGLYLCYLATRVLLAATPRDAGESQPRGLLTAYASTVLLTLTNPLTIASFAAVFAGFGLAPRVDDQLSRAMLVLGVFLGSAAWWLILSSAVGLFRSRVDPLVARWVNRGSGALLMAFGLLALLSIGS